MKDLIDRQALCEYALNQKDKCVTPNDIMRFPSAQPEWKKGKWVPHIEKSREYIGKVLVNVRYDYWFCDTCGYRVEIGQPLYNFCPNCGADTRGESDETN